MRKGLLTYDQDIDERSSKSNAQQPDVNQEMIATAEKIIHAYPGVKAKYQKSANLD